MGYTDALKKKIKESKTVRGDMAKQLHIVGRFGMRPGFDRGSSNLVGEENMIKTIVFFFLIMFTASTALADAFEELEKRGIDRSEIEKARIAIFENSQYKAAHAAAYYCGLLPTKAALDREIKITKKIRGRSGSPSYSRLEDLDNLYRLNKNEIKQQKAIYKAGYGKDLTSAVCKNRNLSAEEDAVHDRLLRNAFTTRVQ
jgi:hypothetical protein